MVNGRPGWLVGFLVLLAGFAPHAALPQGPRGAGPPESIFDPRFGELRRATVAWERRPGPSRRVVDQVCLVPDLPTFLAAIATWDETRWFPVLIDDVETNLNFLRAFRPARVVRLPRTAEPLPPERRWEAVVAAVGRAWVGDEAEPPRGDAPPSRLGPTPPGVVVTAPDSPSLAGAIALAAGRFQPLLRWEPPRRSTDLVSDDEADRMIFDLEARIIARLPTHRGLGDDCDFLTLAVDCPYRVQVGVGPTAGVNAFDDRVARHGPDLRRWAFVGRLTGDLATSAYRAMCALFLPPDSALLFNAYDESSAPWSRYAMRQAAERLHDLLPTTHRAGPDRASLAGWHRAFDPSNRHGLVLLNTSGSPTVMNLAGGSIGHAADVPRTRPVAVVAIHSYSAADPADPKTLAGRWLANGAFIYYGAMNEPYLQAFRSPRLVAEWVAIGTPLAAAVRMLDAEQFGVPWRLHYLGDPLYRPLPGVPTPRVTPDSAGWAVCSSSPKPGAGSDDAARLAWALRAALTLAGRPAEPGQANVADTLLALRREALGPESRKAYDALLADVLFQANRRAVLRERLGRLPTSERSDDVVRWLETARIIDLQQALSLDAFGRATTAWDELVRSDSPEELKGLVTARVSALASSPSRLGAWRQRLATTLRAQGNSPSAAVRAELVRVDSLLGVRKSGGP